MDKMKIEVMEEKKKEILRKIVQFEFDAKTNKNFEILNLKTLELLKSQLRTIEGMIDSNTRNMEKVMSSGSIEK